MNTKQPFKKNDKNRKLAIKNYCNVQIELKRTIEQHITKTKEKGLKTIAQQGLILEHCEANDKN